MGNKRYKIGSKYLIFESINFVRNRKSNQKGPTNYMKPKACFVRIVKKYFFNINY